jgi:cysteine-rich repeat protein
LPLVKPWTAIAAAALLAGCGGDTSLEGVSASPGGASPSGVRPDTPPEDPPPEPDPYCGDGTLDPGEECDDGNTRDTDGCDRDCTYSCTEDPECDDSSVCSVDSCDTTRHICVHGFVSCADDVECTYDHCDDRRGCIHTLTPTWYHDEDVDCHGDPDDTVCGLAETPRGYVENSDDCCDSNHGVHIHQSGWFAFSYDCGAGPTFDYDCDTIEEPRWLDAGRCNLPGCRVVEGWLEVVPGCGATGRYLVECRIDPETGECGPHFDVERTQTCH